LEGIKGKGCQQRGKLKDAGSERMTSNSFHFKDVHNKAV